MGKRIYHCDICHKMGKVFICRYCHYKFCYHCIVKNNPAWLLDNQIKDTSCGIKIKVLLIIIVCMLLVVLLTVLTLWVKIIALIVVEIL